MTAVTHNLWWNSVLLDLSSFCGLGCGFSSFLSVVPVMPRISEEALLRVKDYISAARTLKTDLWAEPGTSATGLGESVALDVLGDSLQKHSAAFFGH